MLEVQELVASHLPWTLQVRALPAATTSITRVTLVEDLERAQGVEPGALVVLTRATAEAAGGYQLDVLVRHAAQRGTAAILLRRSTRHSITAEALAVRAGVALIDVDDDADPADLVDTLGTLVAGDSRSAVRKLATAASQAANYDSDPHEVVQRIGDTCGVRLEYDAAATEGGAAITVEGTQRGIVRAIDRGDIATIAARLAAVVVAETVGRRERLVLSPMRTASAALGQLLTCSQANLAIVAERAAEAGLVVSGWHCAARIAVDHPHSNDVRAELPLLEQEVLALVADRAGIDRAMWTVSRPDDSVVLVRTTRNDSHRDGSRLVQAWLQQVGIILRDGHPGLRFRIGIATPHEGASGLRLSFSSV